MSRLDDVDTYYAISTGRKTFFQKYLDEYQQGNVTGSAKEVAETDKANLISSELGKDRHMPVIDCDYPITAIASSTPGHYHLYIDRELTWEQYKALLDGLLGAGLIEKGWYRNAITDGRTYVRLPNVHKPVSKEGEKHVSGYFPF